MRSEFARALIERSASVELVFLTGDVGFMAFELLAAKLGERFINAGVAEQNMISVAGALSRQGFEVWVYSIAPFCYARPFEQIRNDVAFHGLRVKLVGNGGGYGYGVMGPTHHAIEDYGVLSTLPNMRIFAPVFDDDVASVVAAAAAADGPCYVRLGTSHAPAHGAVPPYEPWRKLTTGGGPLVLAVGALAASYVDAFASIPLAERPNLWAVAELPLALCPPPGEMLAQIDDGNAVLVAEDHVRTGSFGADLALHLAETGRTPREFRHVCARRHDYGVHGSQAFLHELSGLDAQSIVRAGSGR